MELTNFTSNFRGAVTFWNDGLKTVVTPAQDDLLKALGGLEGGVVTQRAAKAAKAGSGALGRLRALQTKGLVDATQGAFESQAWELTAFGRAYLDQRPAKVPSK